MLFLSESQFRVDCVKKYKVFCIVIMMVINRTGGLTIPNFIFNSCFKTSLYCFTDLLDERLAAKMLEYILSVSNSRAYKKLSLETGSGPAFDPAIELYKKYGFKNGDAFGDYEKAHSINSCI